MKTRVVWWSGVLGLSLLFFLADWAGYDKWNPSLFVGHRALADIWWHFPVYVAAVVLVFTLGERRWR